MNELLNEYFSLRKSVEIAQRDYPILSYLEVRQALADGKIKHSFTSDKQHAQFRLKPIDILKWYEKLLARRSKNHASKQP